MKDILATITAYREQRGWTEYQLAEQSGLPQSTISSWYRKKMVPTVPSLEKICNAFGITLSQLFAEKENSVSLTEEQKILLVQWAGLSRKQQEALLALMEQMRQKVEKNPFLADIPSDDANHRFFAELQQGGKQDFQNEERILQVFRLLDGKNKNILIEQGQVLVRNQKQ